MKLASLGILSGENKVSVDLPLKGLVIAKKRRKYVFPETKEVVKKSRTVDVQEYCEFKESMCKFMEQPLKTMDSLSKATPHTQTNLPCKSRMLRREVR